MNYNKLQITNKSFLKQKLEIYGVGKNFLNLHYKKIGLNLRNNPKNLKKSTKSLFFKLTNNYKKDKDLKNELKEIQNFSQKIKTYKGIRNKLKYPCRGQRTHTNAKTKKKFKI